MFKHWPDITAFHVVRKTIHQYPHLLGENQKVTYRAKIKLDGTNLGVQLLNDGKIEVQSRGQTITSEHDNMGSARWVMSNKDLWLKNKPPGKEVIIYGEWAGSAIQSNTAAICKIGHKIFAVFAAQILETDTLIVEPSELEPLIQGIPDTYVLPWFDVSAEDGVMQLCGPWPYQCVVKWLSPAEDLEKDIESINTHVKEVEACDPWVEKMFDISGVGEGLVFYPVSHPGRENFSNLAFKAKGEKHKVTKTKESVQLEPEVASSIGAFIDLVLTEARLEQGARAVANGELVFDSKLTGKFLAWVNQDIIKENTLELEASKLDWKQVQKDLGTKARTWYLVKAKQL